jgi:formylmethanofuran dehydrogenase subunit A
MEDQSTALPASNSTPKRCSADQPGVEAVETLAWSIAQEFVLAIDEFYDTLLSEDEPNETPKMLTAGH